MYSWGPGVGGGGGGGAVEVLHFIFLRNRDSSRAGWRAFAFVKALISERISVILISEICSWFSISLIIIGRSGI